MFIFLNSFSYQINFLPATAHAFVVQTSWAVPTIKFLLVIYTSNRLNQKHLWKQKNYSNLPLPSPSMYPEAYRLVESTMAVTTRTPTITNSTFSNPVRPPQFPLQIKDLQLIFSWVITNSIFTIKTIDITILCTLKVEDFHHILMSHNHFLHLSGTTFPWDPSFDTSKYERWLQSQIIHIYCSCLPLSRTNQSNNSHLIVRASKCSSFVHNIIIHS